MNEQGAMKRGAVFSLPVRITGIDMSTVSSIDFIFKRIPDPSAETLASKTVNTFSGNIANVPLTSTDTYKFPAGTVFMDTKIHLRNGTGIPVTKIVPVNVYETLFAQGA